jgi:hypothetical protein
MKNNTSQAKAYLTEALKNLPQDFALSDVRYHVLSALNKIEHVEKKRGKRAANEMTPQQQWQFQLNQGLVNPFNAGQTVQALEQMIAEEEAKLKAIKDEKSDGGLLTD